MHIKGFITLTAILAILLVLEPITSLTTSSVEARFDPFQLSIIHTNDTHANLDKIANRVTGVKMLREKNPDALLLDAGDVFQGTLYFNAFKGQVDMEFMNLMGYDAMTFGNHEFDLGSAKEGHLALVDFIKSAKFPFVSSNVNFSADKKFTGIFNDFISNEPKAGQIYNGIIKEINGEKIGIFGLTTEETKDISSPGSITFKNYITTAKKTVKAFEKMGVNKIIALSHLGYDDKASIDNDLMLAAKVNGIDVIVGGHSHTKLSKPVIVERDDHGAEKDPTVIVQTGANNMNIGTLNVQFDKKGVITKADGKLLPVSDFQPDPETAERLEKYTEIIKEVAEKEIGITLENGLENPRLGDGTGSKISVRNSETVLGNLITDGMLATAKKYNQNVVMAIQNGGGIRAGIPSGTVTVGEVIKVLPFSNTLAIMEVTGADLKQALEISLKKYPRESSRFLHIAGGKIEFDSTKNAGERIVNVFVKNPNGNYVQIKDEQTYSIVTNTFLAKGAEGYQMFAKSYAAGKVSDTGILEWQNFRDYLAGLKKIPIETEGRIVDVAGQK